MRDPLLAFIAIYVVTAGSASAQTINSLPVEVKLKDLSRPLSIIARKQDQSIKEIQDNFNIIDSRLKDLPEEQRSDYTKSLNAQITLLNKAAQGDVSDETALYLENVRADLNLKRRLVMTADPGSFGAINVAVIPKRAGIPINNLTVAAAPIALVDSPQDYYRFPKLSSPTSRQLPPGRYMFFVYRGTKELVRQLQDVGSMSRSNITLELEVPTE